MRKKIALGAVSCAGIIALIILCIWSFSSEKKYSSRHFGITPYQSEIDRDGDGVDDQTDILRNAKAYVATKPRYESKYYPAGYPDDRNGVCTDVVAFALKDAGYDLRELVNEHILAHAEDYPTIEKPDKNIDFRRVRNLLVYFKSTAIPLTNSIDRIGEWQGGDIVVFNGHIGIVSEKRNKNGIPYVIHHRSVFQKNYEEDILALQEIVGHFRIS